MTGSLLLFTSRKVLSVDTRQEMRSAVEDVFNAGRAPEPTAAEVAQKVVQTVTAVRSAVNPTPAKKPAATPKEPAGPSMEDIANVAQRADALKALHADLEEAKEKLAAHAAKSPKSFATAMKTQKQYKEALEKKLTPSEVTELGSEARQQYELFLQELQEKGKAAEKAGKAYEKTAHYLKTLEITQNVDAAQAALIERLRGPDQQAAQAA
tara:strand:+ start:6856 stop:7485 length:630 start_codon:yes stop_codon:yes gene_type:complete